MRSLLLSLFVLLSVLAPQARGEVSGVVQEVVNPEAPRAEWRRQPVPGAYVTLTWSITIPAPGHATSSCRYAEIARTDQNGRYAMEGPNFITAGLARISVMAYAPGRDRIPFPYPGSNMTERDITMARSTSTPEGRLTGLMVLSLAGCSERSTHDPHGLLKPYFEALHAEGKALKVDTQYGRNVLGGLAASAKQSGAGAQAVPVQRAVVPAEVDQRQMRQADTVRAQ